MDGQRTPEEKEELRSRAVAMRQAGVGAKRIAGELRVSHNLVRELHVGVPVPGSLMRLRAKDDDREAAVLLRQQGRTYDEIRDELGVSKGSLSLWLRELAHPTEQQRRDATSGGDATPLVDLPPDREIARALRTDGWLLREIAAELGVSHKTACLWCAGIAVPARAMHGRSPEEVKAMARARWDPVLAEREIERQAEISAAAATVGSLSARELELIAVTAYLCEGTKSKPWARREFMTFINSDPGVITVYLAWLRRCGVADDQLRLALSIHESADVAAAERYWSKVVGIPVEQFAKPTLKRHNPKTIRRNTGADYYGCLVIGARGSRGLYRHLTGVWQGIVAAAGVSNGHIIPDRPEAGQRTLTP